MAKLPEIQLPGALRESLAQGHPWVYRTHVPPHVHLAQGAWVRLRCGGWSGYGLWDAEGPIAVRVFATRAPPDEGLLRERVQAAWELRAPLRAAGCTAYRWLFGEGDGLPGITVDRYGAYAVLATYAASVEALLPAVVAGLRACDPSLRGVLLRTQTDERQTNDQRPAASDQPDSADAPPSQGIARRSSFVVRRPSVFWGEAPPHDLTVVEHGLHFYADLWAGQKTGLFLDQRENRHTVEGLSAGRSVLNCFAYTGAFSLYALRGGARAVVSADIGKGLAAAAEANIRLNGLDAGRHTFVTGDCFELLARYAGQGRAFDLVILDPPSFARSRQSRYAALRAYVKLNALGLRCVAPGGLLATASCTSQVGPEAFKDALAVAGAQAGRRLQIIHEAGQPLDHPVPAGFPEGRYLKFVVGRVLEER
ncbi:MAG TPA: class I SAM-dependent rRNA methyltransferase [Roseiflexaceae bacterium]|nr:class I SAM-dependent rRNA methyltransferase [Roseiflexaceae bacterium]